MIKFFNYLQYLFYPFFVLTLFYIIKGSFFNFNIEDIGFGVLCMGIAFGFSSMGDMTKISKKEIELFKNKKRFKKLVNYLIIVGFSLIFVTVLFICQKWINNNDYGNQIYQLGLNCAPLIIAVFFTLKQLIDKKHYFELTNKKTYE